MRFVCPIFDRAGMAAYTERYKKAMTWKSRREAAQAETEALRCELPMG
jgi:hypothetical protein